jgi:PAS domain S-box-containing protein/putative nucleotidyltransferase with HDIG domain
MLMPRRRRQVLQAALSSDIPVALLAGRMTDGVMIVDPRLRLRYCNSAFAELIGRNVEQLTGTCLDNLLQEPDLTLFHHQWDTRRSGSSKAYELTWTRPDGGRVTTEVRPVPLFDSTGAFDGSLSVVANVTERRHLEAELNTARVIVENSSALLYRARLEEGFHIEHVSGDLAHFGFTAEQLVSGHTQFINIIHGDDLPNVINTLVAHVSLGRRTFIQRYRMRKASGEILWVEDRTTVREVPGRVGLYLEGLVTDESDLRRTQNDLRSALTQTIDALVAAIDKRDPYTAGHQRRVANLSRAIAVRLELGSERADAVYLGALVHDVGKIAIPVDILTRPGKLTPEELALVRTHAQTGADVLRGVVFPWPILDMVAQHHERLDGSGYPHGLKGDAIALEARIVAVADVFESMSTARPYRPSLGAEAAIQQLMVGRGTQYDAAAVEACLALVSEQGSAGDLWGALGAEAAIASKCT